MSDAWQGEELIVIGIDIGTTQSAASIVHLQPGCIPKVRVVSRWPSSPNSSKIPTTILYDEAGTARAFGAETKEEGMLERARDEDWTEAKWFKLWVHPQTMAPPAYSAVAGPAAEQHTSFEAPPLPPNVTVQRCYIDFIRYLYENTVIWFKSMPDGDVIWSKLEKRVKLVVSHPNGWGMKEQEFLREAVVDAGIGWFTTVETTERLGFVTEAEASVHFGLVYTADLSSAWLAPGSSFAVVDAGGSTVDICCYSVEALTPKLRIRETKTSDCIQSGAIFVTRAAEEIIKAKLGDSKYNTPEFVAVMVDQFENKTKLHFDSPAANYVIKFGYDRDTDPTCGISRGRLTLTGAEVERAFQPCVADIIKHVSAQIKNTNVKNILLVGGFGESPYLQRRLRKEFEQNGLRVVIADEPSKKAVAEGASLFFFKGSVVARATRFEFGIEVVLPATLHAQTAGLRGVLVLPSGDVMFRGGWSTIIKAGTVVETEEFHKSSFQIEVLSDCSLVHTVTLRTYDGPDGMLAHDGWARDVEGHFYPNFNECCTITANLAHMASTTRLRINNVTGESYWKLNFEVAVFFGGTALKACLIWKENNEERRGPASIIPPASY